MKTKNKPIYLDCEMIDDTGILHAVIKTGNRVKVLVRVFGTIVYDGVKYEYDKNVEVATKKVKGN